ncbi:MULTISPECIES: BON domain-containing protein [Rhizobium]|uniref:BON domain-containing protein n=1 Tax=Rhizobium TaxID=379 RepID=UPI00103BB563|nr:MULTISPECIES: BON domain-containing protein [Rhizobium]MBY3380950.1 BON domain-containing protein [Rhizobium laguerreae]MDU0310720.1 BON domain-containing protein [Rhizobium sp. 10PS4]TBY06871.1 BON domain-containing protein [Rhizobium laguerreae]
MYSNDIIPIGADVLSTAVRTHLQMELGLTHQDVKATVSQGVVTLRGKLGDATRREAARVSAESVSGVRRVINDISMAYHMAGRASRA